MFLNGSLSIGNNNTVDLKVFFGHDRVHYNLNYVNTLSTDLQIKGIEVSSKSMFLQYPSPQLLSSPEKQSVYLGTLTYDPTEEFNSCIVLLASKGMANPSSCRMNSNSEPPLPHQ